MNAFHQYSHSLSCQLQWGPSRIQYLGLGDGEGVERDWSSKSHLVSMCRVSSAQLREALLNAQTKYRVCNKDFVVLLPNNG